VSVFQGTYAPDVAYDADPVTGFAVYDSYNGGWQSVGGTSAGCPQWAALFAIVAQGRAYAGRASLDGPSETLNALYGINKKAFHDITTGANSNYAAQPGYDLVTGRGSPVAPRAVAGLVGWNAASTLTAAVVEPMLAPTFSTTLTPMKGYEGLFSDSAIL
jgi:subtilase family serine protease